MENDPKDGDFLTVTPAAGEVVGDTSDDLVIGAPGENVDLFADEGAVAVLRGSSARLTATGNTLLTSPRPRTRPRPATSSASSWAEPQLQGNGEWLTGCSRPAAYLSKRNGSSRGWGSPSSSAAARAPTPTIL